MNFTVERVSSILEICIVSGESFDASLRVALDACGFFEWKSEDAKREASGMANVITDNWKQALKQKGVTKIDPRIYADAFEHVETSHAKMLDW